MATTDISHAPGVSIFSRIWDGLMAISERLYTVSEGARCARLAAHLGQKSDVELAAMGLQRREIVRYAFRNHLST